MSLRIIETKSATKSLADLPERIQDKYHTQKKRFQTDRRDPRLHLKKAVRFCGSVLASLTRAYRALFYYHTTDTAIIFAIGHRKDIYDK